MHVIKATNVNDAYHKGASLINQHGMLTNTRAGEALVISDPVTTVYSRPCERVLFDVKRDANPFFHFFEALWILNGQRDVKSLAYFNKRMAEFSDDGVNFHASYGYRLRNPIDQIKHAIALLRGNPSNRQVVLQIWDHVQDLAVSKKDIPCNDMIKLRVVDGRLDLMVFCRSNDMIWGAYGANVVQFSTLQEYIAGCVGIPVGRYYQISCDFHAYKDVWEKCDPLGASHRDPYMVIADHFPMFYGYTGHWDVALAKMMTYVEMSAGGVDFSYDALAEPYFDHVAIPLLRAWVAYKAKDIRLAIAEAAKCAASDWSLAATLWLERRV